MTTNIVFALVMYLCPDLEAMSKEYIIQGEQVTCMEYYTKQIVENPDKYKNMVKYVEGK